MLYVEAECDRCGKKSLRIECNNFGEFMTIVGNSFTFLTGARRDATTGKWTPEPGKIYCKECVDIYVEIEEKNIIGIMKEFLKNTNASLSANLSANSSTLH